MPINIEIAKLIIRPHKNWHLNYFYVYNIHGGYYKSKHSQNTISVERYEELEKLRKDIET